MTNELIEIINATSPTSAVGFVASAYHDYDIQVNKILFKSKCKKSCNYCCNDYFYISEAEFYIIVYYMYYYKNKAFINNIRDNSMQQYRSLLKLYPKEAQYLSQYIQTQQYKSDIIKFSPGQYMRLDKPCPFLINGKCSIYSVRPLVCRAYGTETGNKISKCNNVRYRGKFSYNKTDDFLRIVNHTFSGNVVIRRYPLFYFLSHLTNIRFWDNIELILERATKKTYKESISWHNI